MLATPKSRSRRSLPAALPALLLLLLAAPARAGDCDQQDPIQKSKDQESEGQTSKDQFHIEERDGKKVYVIDKVITVCGKVPRPLVAYVLQARTINYQWETLKQDFLPKILEPVKEEPF